MCRNGIRILFASTFSVMAYASVVGEGLSSESYVQNGLIGHWDGIENSGKGGGHDSSALYWKDLTGVSGDFSVFPDVASFTGNGLKKNAAGVMATNVVNALRTGVRTIEVVVSGIPSEGWVNAFFIRPNATVSINNSAKDGKRGYFFDNANAMHGWLTDVKLEQETVALILNGGSDAVDNFYLNASRPAGEGYKNNWGNATHPTMHIGGRTGYPSGSDANAYGYTVHAIRLYNRVLTSEEIAKNASIDQVRFFGALPASVDGNMFAVAATANAGGYVSADGVAKIPSSSAISPLMACDAAKDALPVVLRASPMPGWRFAGWSGEFAYVVNGSDSTPVITVKSSISRNYSASFEREIGYIQDGLVGYWDGIENAGEGRHDSDSGCWVDLSGQGGDFIVNSEAATFGETGLHKIGAKVAATNLLVHTGVLTIESAVSKVKLDSGKWLNAAYLGYDQTLSFRNETDGKRQFFFDYDNLKWLSNERAPEMTMSVTYEMVNGKPKGKDLYFDGATPDNGAYAGENMYWGGVPQTYTSIGGRMEFPNSGDTTATNYTVNALRFYNRRLSSGEIAYNAAVDRLKFRGFGKDGFAYRIVDGVIQCQFKVWTGGVGGTVKLGDRSPVRDCDATEWIPFGTEQTMVFSAQPDDGWQFAGWTGDVGAIVSGSAADLTVSVRSVGGVALQAQFTQTAEYVKDGLIGFWDARENAGFGKFDADASAWKDLTGISGDFFVNSLCGTFEEDALCKVAMGRMAFNPARRTDIRTIEVVLSDLPGENSYWTMPVFVSANQHISLQDKDGNRQFFCDYNKYGLKTSERPGQMTIALLSASQSAAEKLHINAVVPTGETYKNSWSDLASGMMTMGGRDGKVNTANDDRQVGYSIHAVRFYNRQLTPSEMRRNARLDGIRYFGRPALGTIIVVR